MVTCKYRLSNLNLLYKISFVAVVHAVKIFYSPCRRNIAVAITDKMETYRSGHNGAHSKCVCPPGHEGSNPSVSAIFAIKHCSKKGKEQSFPFFDVFIYCYPHAKMKPQPRPGVSLLGQKKAVGIISRTAVQSGMPPWDEVGGHFPIEHVGLILCFLCMPCRCPSSMRFWLFAFFACFVSFPRACGAPQASFPHAARQPYRHADLHFGPIRTPPLSVPSMQDKVFLPFA